MDKSCCLIHSSGVEALGSLGSKHLTFGDLGSPHSLESCLVYSTVCGAMHTTMAGVHIDLLGGGGPIVHGIVALERTAAMHSSMGGGVQSILAMHGTVGWCTTMYRSLGGRVQLILTVYGSVERS